MQNSALLEIFRSVITDNLPKFESAVSSGTGDDLKVIASTVQAIRSAAKVVGIDPVAELCKSMESFLNQLIESGGNLSELHENFFVTAGEIFREFGNKEPADIAGFLSEKRSVIQDLAGYFSKPLAPVQQEPPKKEKKEVKPNYDPVLVDLFKIELESHTKVLEKGLVDAEGETSNEKLEPLMRSAHSIKGAARIVGVHQAVGLAHAMEDLLSHSLKGEIRLTGSHIDLLLKGNDLFKMIAALPVDEIFSEIDNNIDQINSLSSALTAASKGETAPSQPAQKPKTTTESGDKQSDSPSPVQTQAAPPPFPSPQPQRQEKKEDALFVRVLAENLNRLLGLAGEIKIQAKFTKPFQGYLLATKQTLREAVRSQEGLNAAMENLGVFPEVAAELDSTQEVLERLEWNINTMIDKFDVFSRNIERLSESLGNQVIESKMRPIADGLHGIPRMVRDLAKDSGKKIRLEIVGEDTMIDRDILDKIEAPLSHLIANAADHGIESPEERIEAGKKETGKILLEAGHRAGFLTISVSDDGKGIDDESLRKKIVEKGYVTAEMAGSLSKSEILDFLFLPGFSTKAGVTKVSGRGVGLDIVMNLIHQVGGKTKIESEPGKGSVFTLQLPVTLSVIRALLFKVNSELYAIPLARVETLLSIREEEILTVEDRQFIKWNNENLGIVNCARLMNLPGESEKGTFINLAVIGDRTAKYAVAVDAFLGERDLVVSAMDGKLGKIPNISAAAILEEGSVALIIDPDDLVRSIEKYIHGSKLDKVTSSFMVSGKTRKILVVDDSLTVREVERKLLENNGYSVTTAVDGVDGFNSLQREDFDLVITDVDMPRMNGIQLVEKIKSDPKFKTIPVMIVSYKDREEDRLRGLNAGANYYLTKSSFHDESLVNAVIDLIGEAK
ncbi:MAG: response regulator [Bacteroidetes bacterium]|nr:response regulator [Bacteroidota bacterium]